MSEQIRWGTVGGLVAAIVLLVVGPGSAETKKPIVGQLISKDGTVQLYLSFANFVSALNSDLSGGAKVRGFFAVGGFDGPDNLLSATTIAVILD